MVPRLIGLYSPAAQSGKSTVANHLVEKHGFTRIGFSDTLKAAAKTILMGSGMTEERAVWWLTEGKDMALPEPFGVSMRWFLQTLGTNWGRDCINRRLWVEIAASKANFTDGPVVFDDVRFPEEAARIEAMGGEVWKVERPQATRKNSHPSEGLLEGRIFDEILFNDRDVADLLETADMCLAR